MKHLPQLDTEIDWRCKGFWNPGPAISDEEFIRDGHTLFDGSFTWPVMALRSDALEHNVDVMASFTKQYGLDFAPHAKTTMSPQLIDLQIDRGAWGVSVATVNQALAAFSFGVKRVLIANEVLDPNALSGLALAAATRDAELLVYIDSVVGLEVMATAAREVELPVKVLVELGHPDGRTGCRSAEAAVTLARAAATTGGVHLAGISGYEGGLPDADYVNDYLATLCGTFETAAQEGLFNGPGVLSVGGSQWYDLVAKALNRDWSGARPLLLLRSGAYVTHDDGIYRRRTPFTRIDGELVPAIEVWAQVTSTPEPGLAIIGMGKRDVPYDEGLPVPKLIRRRGSQVVEAFTQGTIEKTNDQHAYLRIEEGAALAVGDLVCFGISHPCTAFDKWNAMPIVDQDRKIVDIARIYL